MIIHIFYTYIHIHLMNKYIKQQTKAFLKKTRYRPVEGKLSNYGQWDYEDYLCVDIVM